MANVIATSGSRIVFTTIDTDWKHTDTFSDLEHIKLDSIIFVPGAASDELIVRDGAIDGPEIIHVLATDTNDQRALYGHGVAVRPFIDVSECTFTAGAKIIFTFA